MTLLNGWNADEAAENKGFLKKGTEQRRPAEGTAGVPSSAMARSSVVDEASAAARGARALPKMMVRQSSRHFIRLMVKFTGSGYPKFLLVSQQKPGKRIFT